MEVKNENNEIKTQVNVNELKVDIAKVIKNATSEDRENSDSFEDPTKPYSPTSTEIEIEDFTELEDNLSKLKEDRMLLMYCPDYSLLNSAKLALIRKLLKLDNYKCRVLGFQDKNKERTDLNLGIFTDSKLAENSNTIFIVEVINESSADTFFDSLFNRAQRGELIKSRLKSNNIFVLISYTNYSLKEKAKEKKSQLYFPQWFISYEKYLNYILKDIFPENDDYIYLHESIVEQKKYGLFEEDDEGLHEVISKKLEEGKRAFYEKISGNKQKVEELKANNEKRIQKIGPEQLIAKHPEVKDLLYVTAFFPQLRLREFIGLASEIMANKVYEVHTEESYINKKGKKKSKAQIKQVKLVDEFRGNADVFFQKAKIEEIKTDDLSTIVDFNEPYLRKEVKQYYLKKYPNYVKDQFLRIINLDLLFRYDVSYQYIENIVRLVAETAITDPDFYGKKLLYELGLGKFINKDDDDPKEDYIKAILDLFNNAVERNHNLYRLSFLISEMLEHPQLKKSIDKFFSFLIESCKAPEVVLEILRRLRYSENLDKLFWLKRIFNESGSDKMEVMQNGYNYLILLGRQSTSDIYDFSKRVKQWWQDENKDYEIKENELHRFYGISFLYSYATSAIYALPEKFYGDYPSKYALFSNFYELEPEDIAQKINFIVKWIFNKNLDGIFFNNDGYEFDMDTINSNADLIEHWSLILFGKLKKKNINENSKLILKTILTEIKRNTNRLTRSNLRDAWFQKTNYYLKNEANLKFDEIKKRSLFNFRRKNLERLIKYFDKSKSK